MAGRNPCQTICRARVEVAPAYDHAEITGIAASHAAYELLSAMALSDGP